MITTAKEYLLPLELLCNKEQKIIFFKGVVARFEGGKHLLWYQILPPSFLHPGCVKFSIVIGEEESICEFISPQGHILKRGGVVNDEVYWDHTCPLPK